MQQRGSAFEQTANGIRERCRSSASDPDLHESRPSLTPRVRNFSRNIEHSEDLFHSLRAVDLGPIFPYTHIARINTARELSWKARSKRTNFEADHNVWQTTRPTPRLCGRHVRHLRNLP